GTRDARRAGGGGARPASQDATAGSADATLLTERTPAVPPPPPRPVDPPRPVKPPRPVATPPAVAWWPWVTGAALAAVVATVVVLWPTSAPPPELPPTPATSPAPSPAPPLAPLRFAAIDPPGATALRVPVGERKRFAVTVADAERHPNVGVVWRLDGREAGRGTTFEFRAE